jgi:RNA polymerase sigma factor (sigma-70 family)
VREKKIALEAYLVASARLGDTRALNRLVALHGPRLLTHAARLLGERDAAHDMVQEAWIEIMRGLGGLRDDAAFLPWALRIVSRRVAREIKRRQKLRRRDEALQAEPDEPNSPDQALRIDSARVAAAIARLSPAQSATMALFYLEEMSVTDVAMALDVPVGTVKTRLMHARTKLRAMLEGESDG